MTLPVQPVTCRFRDQSGDPLIGARVEFALTVREVYNGIVVPERLKATTDADGRVVVNVFPNALGTAGSQYRVRAWRPTTGAKILDSLATVPDSPCQLHLILSEDPYPAVDASQLALQEAQGALALVTAQAGAAEGSAIAASDSASAASDSALAASGSASTASDKANEAADSADLARDWATKLGSEVAPGEGYSARHHADAAAGSALAASGSALAASGSASAASGSASAASGSASAASGSALAASGSAGTATTKAQDAADAAALAQDWAEKTGEVEPGAYSAKHHAQAAAGSATQAAVNAAAVNTTYGAYIAPSTGDVIPGGYPAARSARESVTLDRFFAEVMEGAGSCKVAVYVNNALVHGPVLVAAGSPVTQTGLTIAVPAGARMDMQLSEVTDVQAVWAQIDGGPA